MDDSTSPPPSFLQDGPSELWLQIVSFGNVQDASRLAVTCRRAYYWVHRHRQLRGPEFVAATCDERDVMGTFTRSRDLVKTALAKLQGPPQLCFSFRRTRNVSRWTREVFSSFLPPNTICLEAASDSIQSALPGTEPECQSAMSLFLGSLPAEDATVLPFGWAIPDDEDDEDCPTWTSRALLPQLAARQTLSGDSNYWKVVVIYASHGAGGQAETLVHTLQATYPQATIVGGICESGLVSQSTAEDATREDWLTWSNEDLLKYLQSMGITSVPDASTNTKAQLIAFILESIETRPYRLKEIGGDNASEGVFGLILGGPVPVHSVVSRGVESLVTRGPPQPTSTCVVEEADYRQPTDEAYMFRSRRGDDSLPAYHLIRRIRDRATGSTYSMAEWVRAHGAADLVGLRQPETDGFILHNPHPMSRNLGGFLFFADSNLPEEAPLTGYEIDLFHLDGAACRQDVNTTLQALQQEVADQKLLGALMFSCSARGPTAGMLGEAMCDATAFRKHFSETPLLGWYAGGEIGPSAMAGRRQALRQSQQQRATLQGFTAVFALWIVPVVDWTTVPLDDSEETVRNFCQDRLVSTMDTDGSD
jgi:hypothetical protein